MGPRTALAVVEALAGGGQTADSTVQPAVNTATGELLD
jgi:hypothetical protein